MNYAVNVAKPRDFMFFALIQSGQCPDFTRVGSVMMSFFLDLSWFRRDSIIIL